MLGCAAMSQTKINGAVLRGAYAFGEYHYWLSSRGDIIWRLRAAKIYYGWRIAEVPAYPTLNDISNFFRLVTKK